MTVEVGIKSDSIEYRYTFEWLFRLMERMEVRHLQMGSSFEMYHLPDRYFIRLRRQAADHGVSIDSCFTAHRELGGLLSSDPDLRRIANESYRRWIEIGSLVGASSVGSNPGAIYRDEMDKKESATLRYLEEMVGIAEYAHTVGLEALTLETMSALGEPPTTKAEIDHFMARLNEGVTNPGGSLEAEDRTGVRAPVYVCADMSHGYADSSGKVVESNLELFEHAIPWMWEFHIKNTDSIFNSTFGFGPDEAKAGIVDLAEVARIIAGNAERFPREQLIGYLEHPGPKLGRDYTDGQLGRLLTDSIAAINRDFLPLLEPARVR